MNIFDHTADIILENGRVKLEPLSFEHTKYLQPIIDKDTGKIIYSAVAVYHNEDINDYIKTALQSKIDKTRYPFAIYDKAAGGYAGSTSFMSVDNMHKRLEIGHTWLGIDFQRTGLNRNMKYLMLQYTFETLGFNRAQFAADSRNIQSRTAIENIGGIFEGEFRSHGVLPGGKTRNSVFYSILKEEWPQVKAEKFKSIIR